MQVPLSGAFFHFYVYSRLTLNLQTAAAAGFLSCAHLLHMYISMNAIF